MSLNADVSWATAIALGPNHCRKVSCQLSATSRRIIKIARVFHHMSSLKEKRKSKQAVNKLTGGAVSLEISPSTPINSNHLA